jgi:hypothetical protein
MAASTKETATSAGFKVLEIGVGMFYDEVDATAT